MSITCDRCHKEMKTSFVTLAVDGFAVAVSATGNSYSDTPDLCLECLEDIARHGKVVDRRAWLDSLSSPPSKKEGE